MSSKIYITGDCHHDFSKFNTKYFPEQEQMTKSDYMITHCCATSLQNKINSQDYKPDALTDFLEIVRQNVSFKKWYFGHYHKDQQLTEREILLFDRIIELGSDLEDAHLPDIRVN